MSKLADWFETKVRENGESFVSLKDDRPDWLQDAVRAAHGDMLPNDWVYAECLAACEAIDEGTVSADDTHDHVDGRVDIYTKTRFTWAAGMCLSDLFSQAEEDAEGMGGASVADRLGVIQYQVIDSIVQTVLNAWQAQSSDDDESDDSGDGDDAKGPHFEDGTGLPHES